MKIEDLNKNILPIVRIDKTLDKYEGKVVFPKKLDQANKALKTVGLPKKKAS